MWSSLQCHLPSTKMRTDILLVTYRKDYDWTVFCLRSIEKFAFGFGGVTLVCPVDDEAIFVALAARHSRSDLPILVKGYIPKKGYEFNHHQVMKCYSDVLCPKADYVLHIDSDCIFTDLVAPNDYFKDEKPYLLMRTYQPSEPWYIWRKPTSAALGVVCNHETMVRHPAVHPVATYRDLREYMEKLHGIPFSEWVLKQPGNYPACHFSEFNTLGSYVLIACAERYEVVDTDKADQPPSNLVQGWSWGGVDTAKENYEKILSR